MRSSTRGRCSSLAVILLSCCFVNSRIHVEGFVVKPGGAACQGKHQQRHHAAAGKVMSRLHSTKEQSTSTGAASDASSVPAFVVNAFATECDNVNRPPSLNIILRSLHQLTSPMGSSDIRGRFVDHKRLGNIASVAHEIGKTPAAEGSAGQPPLTPFAAHCLGHALASMLLDRQDREGGDSRVTIAIGIDPREHGMRLTDAFCRGCESRDPSRVKVVYTGISTTPACAWFTSKDFPRKVDAAVMVTASHLPRDRNGFKFFLGNADDCMFTKEMIHELGRRAQDCAADLFQNSCSLPPTSGDQAVMCSEWVDWMPEYAKFLKDAIRKEVGSGKYDRPLKGLKIVLNAGNGAGGFFSSVLGNLGADVTGSINIEADGQFPSGVPNPESKDMERETIKGCKDAQADLGIMLDTDADRCGFVVPSIIIEDGTRSDYEALNRNRLIALLGVVFARSSPGCTFVTCSVTSEGLTAFLEGKLGLKHVRYLKGYANVINKAKELDAEVGIETSGHCAMKENNYLDDGTYTAVKIVGLLARERVTPAGDNTASLLDLIGDMEELDEEAELRMTVRDESLDTMQQTFDFCAVEIERLCDDNNLDKAAATWQIDQENLEGIRVRFGEQQFFMLRKSLHDPLISLQIEAKSKENARKLVVEPLIRLFQSELQIKQKLDMSVLQEY